MRTRPNVVRGRGENNLVSMATLRLTDTGDASGNHTPGEGKQGRGRDITIGWVGRTDIIMGEHRKYRGVLTIIGREHNAIAAYTCYTEQTLRQPPGKQPHYNRHCVEHQKETHKWLKEKTGQKADAPDSMDYIGS